MYYIKCYQICKSRVENSSINDMSSIHLVLDFTQAHCHIIFPRDRVHLDERNSVFASKVHPEFFILGDAEC